MVFPAGKISFYDSKNTFEAICRNPKHGKCVLSRTRNAAKSKDPNAVPKGGRPLGFLGAWLLQAHCETKAEHWSYANLRPSREARGGARNFIKKAHNGMDLLSKERPQKTELEDSEPETLEGYI